MMQTVYIHLVPDTIRRAYGVLPGSIIELRTAFMQRHNLTLNLTLNTQDDGR